MDPDRFSLRLIEREANHDDDDDQYLRLSDESMIRLDMESGVPQAGPSSRNEAILYLVRMAGHAGAPAVRDVHYYVQGGFL